MCACGVLTLPPVDGISIGKRRVDQRRQFVRRQTLIQLERRLHALAGIVELVLADESREVAAALHRGDTPEAAAESGADGLMIGRGCYGRPWFIAQIIAWLRSRRRLPDPPLAAQYGILRHHYEAMLSHYGTPGIHIARKHIGWYSKGLPGSAEFRAAVNRTEAAAEVQDLIRRFYEPLLEREAA